MPSPTSGRRAQAARNDELILAAARAVFVADPGAPIAAVAERAGVGISALYRRHGSKEDLLRTLCRNGLATYVELAERALSVADPWEGFAGFLRGVVTADTHSLTTSLAGTFTPTRDMTDLAEHAATATARLVARAQDADTLRRDVVPEDVGLLLEQLAAIRGADEARTGELRGRSVALLLDALRVPSGHRPLPGPGPRAGEFRDRWERRSS